MSVQLCNQHISPGEGTFMWSAQALISSQATHSTPRAPEPEEVAGS